MNGGESYESGSFHVHHIGCIILVSILNGAISLRRGEVEMWSFVVAALPALNP
jgi:hypothetical protein